MVALLNRVIFIVLHVISSCCAWDLEKNCESKKCLNKCCQNGFFLKNWNCEPGSSGHDFSEVDIYTIDMYKTGKSLNDTFRLLPGKIEDLRKFEDLNNLNLLFKNFYVTEDGDLWGEIPNTYDRWHRIANGNYCVEYKFMNGVKSLNFLGVVLEIEIPETNDNLAYAILISCAFLLLVLIVYALLSELRKLGGLILMAYVFSLFWGFLLFAVIKLGTYWMEVCRALTLLIYFSLLSSFFWTNVMSFDIWWTFRSYATARPIHRRGEGHKFLMYCLYAWGVPLVMTIVLVILNTTGLPQLPWFITPHIPGHGCFGLDDAVKFLYLYFPMVILIITNWIFYLMTAYNVWQLSRGTEVLSNSMTRGTSKAHRTQRRRFLVYLKLSIVMGLNWLFEVASFLWPEFKGWYITDMYNIFIGFAIFLIFVCKPKIFRKLKQRLNSRNMQRSPTVKSHSGTLHTNLETATKQVCYNPKGFV